MDLNFFNISGFSKLGNAEHYQEKQYVNGIPLIPLDYRSHNQQSSPQQLDNHRSLFDSST